MQAPYLSALSEVFRNFIQVALGLVGVIAIIMIVAAGFQFLSAGYDKEGAARARRTITYATIGLLVAVSAWIIIRLLGQFLGVNLDIFRICLPGTTC